MLICLSLFYKTGFSQSSVDSMLVKFISDVESKVVYDTQYVNPTNKDSIWSAVDHKYRSFYESPSFYGEALNNGFYFEKICIEDSSFFVIILYDRGEYNFVQCSFCLKGSQIGEASIAFVPKEGQDCTYIYDKAHYLSEIPLWVKIGKGSKEIISLVDFQRQISILSAIMQ